MKLNIRRNTAPGEEKRPLPGLLAEKIKSRLGGKPGKKGRVRRRLIAAVLVVAVMAGGGMYLLGGGQTHWLPIQAFQHLHPVGRAGVQKFQQPHIIHVVSLPSLY